MPCAPGPSFDKASGRHIYISPFEPTYQGHPISPRLVSISFHYYRCVVDPTASRAALTQPSHASLSPINDEALLHKATPEYLFFFFCEKKPICENSRHRLYIPISSATENYHVSTIYLCAKKIQSLLIRTTIAFVAMCKEIVPNTRYICRHVLNQPHKIEWEGCGKCGDVKAGPVYLGQTIKREPCDNCKKDGSWTQNDGKWKQV